MGNARVIILRDFVAGRLNRMERCDVNWSRYETGLRLIGRVDDKKKASSRRLAARKPRKEG